MSRFRVLPNGDLIFPEKGNPPNDNIPGYRRDPANPFYFFMEMEDCSSREMKVVVKPCGKTRSVMWCNLYHLEVNAYKCESCDQT
jgi:hypothetical protein